MRLKSQQSRKLVSYKKSFRSLIATGTCGSPTLRNEKSVEILKAIHERKLKLTCTICASRVVNMSDHLLKKHNMRDRSARKSFTDQVKVLYLSSQEHSSIEAPPQTNCSDQESPDSEVKHFNEQQRLADKPTSATSEQHSSSSGHRKMIKCPECKDKYFVNISDHLIKIHQLNTRALRKPVLKQIKEISRSAHSSYFDEQQYRQEVVLNSANEIDLKQDNRERSLIQGKFRLGF